MVDYKTGCKFLPIMQEDLTVTITVNDELANYYFGKPIYRTYIDKFAGHSYLIGVKFDALGYPVSDAITVVYKDTRSGTDKAIDYGLTLYEVGNTIKAIISLNPEGVLITIGIEGIKHENDIQWISEEIIWGNNHFPQENDNNAVVGG